MNKAFVKETDDAQASNPVPDRPIPTGPNLVTPDGLDHLDKMIAKAEQDHTEALASDDVNELARTERDRRYWSTRRATAQVAEQKRSGTTVEFGSTVRISRDGEEQTYRIVGADEADPADGALSHNAPLARALLGKSKGDEIAVGGKSIEIVRIE